MNQGNLLALGDIARQNTADTDVAQKVVVVQHCNLHLQGSVGHSLGRGNVGQNRIQNGSNIFALFFHFKARPTGAAGGINNREIQLFVRCAQFHKKVKHFVHYFAGADVFAVHFIDNYNRL